MVTAAEEFFELTGTVIDPAAMKIAAAIATLQACRDYERYKVLDVRTFNGTSGCCEILVVECQCDRIPSHPVADIRYPERLALWFPDDGSQPHVYALRKDFPKVLHLMQTDEGSIRAFCLYFEPWSAARITWTPRRFLDRIIWWLEQNAVGKLHRGDQPLERLFFPFKHQIFLNFEVAEAIKKPDIQLDVWRINDPSDSRRVYGAMLVEKGEPVSNTSVAPIVVEFDGLVHGVQEYYPRTLGQLSDQIKARGGNFLEAIEKIIVDRCRGNPIPFASASHAGLLLLSLSMVREPSQVTERRDFQAFGFSGGVGALGEAFGWLSRDSKKGFVYSPLIGKTGPQLDDWRELSLEPIEVIEGLAEERIRALTDVDNTTAQFTGIIAGAGALGSSLINLWAREAWGTWAVFDNDLIRPHNVVRHEATAENVGQNKALTMEALANAIHPRRKAVAAAFSTELAEFESAANRAATAGAALLVDASTSLDVPRNAALSEHAPRTATLFLTPLGTASVLMLEDKVRQLRVDQIEAQYYRALIRNAWGEHHLDGNFREYWVGAGCRDLSAVISPEAIQLHAALLSSQLRKNVTKSDANLAIFETREEGGVESRRVALKCGYRRQHGDWAILIDEGLLETARKLRAEALPAETGGVLLGTIDHHRKVIALVDAIGPPPDSVKTQTSFERGTEGVESVIKNANDRTAGFVTYVGEWHSHPPKVAAKMSRDDFEQILHLTIHLAADGDPSVMLIVGGKNDWQTYIGVAL
jgi:integrative and conjugative element protein (TIGR02256 family)